MDPILSLVNETFQLNKQAIIFVNSKRSAESVAEKVSKATNYDLEDESNQILNVLSTPTKQCRRLSKIVRKGVAFHHSGLNSKQRDIVENNFKQGKIKVICATPTLAAGVDMPAFRVIIRDLKRYSGFGMSYIPVLEYQQMIGRAGRPSFDSVGEAIVLVNSEKEKEEVTKKYIFGDPENIYSKLAVEPVLRTYVLSLISTGFANTFEDVMKFMKKTFYAHQYADFDRLEFIIFQVVEKLKEWRFLDSKFKVTLLGRRVSELYIDPFSANFLLENIKEDANYFSLIHLICSTYEMRPLINIRKADRDLVESHITKDDVLYFDGDLSTIKTALVLDYYKEEYSEEYLYENFSVTPGELNAKIERADWLLYALSELSKIDGFKLSTKLTKLRVMIKNGVREELLPLLKFKGIGRVRARKLYKNKIKNLKDVKNAPLSDLKILLGDKIALNIKSQI